MRFLHTSDWHLGRSLHQQDLHSYQEDVLREIEALVESERVDVVLVAGDVFDRAVPPVESVALFTETLNRLSTKCVVVVTSGNHDSAIRLGYGSKLFREGIHIATDTASVGRGIDVTAANISVRIYPVPYLVPDHAREVLKTSDEPLARSHQAVLQAATDRIREDLATLTAPPDATVVLAHAFVTGPDTSNSAETSDSERDIRVGGVDVVTSDVFRDFDYVALGHLHGPQNVGGPTGSKVRYSGSPLRYSFSEAHQSKSVTLFDITQLGVTDVRAVDITQPRPMGILSGSLDEVMAASNIDQYANAWVQVVITDDARPPELVATVHAEFPHALSIIHRPESIGPIARDQAAELSMLSPPELTARFIDEVSNQPVSESERKIISEVYEISRTKVET